jgi:hypothetical protein
MDFREKLALHLNERMQKIAKVRNKDEIFKSSHLQVNESDEISKMIINIFENVDNEFPEVVLKYFGEHDLLAFLRHSFEKNLTINNCEIQIGENGKNSTIKFKDYLGFPETIITFDKDKDIDINEGFGINNVVYSGGVFGSNSLSCDRKDWKVLIVWALMTSKKQ